MVTAMDDAIADVMNSLQKSGLASNTITLFTSDVRTEFIVNINC